MAQYQPHVIEDYFDRFGSKEWDRLVKTPTEEIKLEVHAHYLRSFVTPGSRVLEVGAGPGRFTQILASLGCAVTVTDISQIQLDLNRKYANELGFASSIDSWSLTDICDLGLFPDNSFDSLICYGGPLSYVLDQRERALTECKRVVKEDGLILLSVMSLWGSIHAHLPAVLEAPPESNRLIINSGDLVPENLPGNKHDCHMYRAKELRYVLEEQSLLVLEMSASNTLATVWGDSLSQIRQSPERWTELITMEIEASREEGCLDCGTHIIAIVQKPGDPVHPSSDTTETVEDFTLKLDSIR